MESHREDLDTILEARVSEYEAPFAKPVEVTVLAALFSIVIVPQPLQQERARATELEMRMSPGLRRNAMSWRLQGKPRLLIRRPAS